MLSVIHLWATKKRMSGDRSAKNRIDKASAVQMRTWCAANGISVVDLEKAILEVPGLCYKLANKLGRKGPYITTRGETEDGVLCACNVCLPAQWRECTEMDTVAKLSGRKLQVFGWHARSYDVYADCPPQCVRKGKPFFTKVSVFAKSCMPTVYARLRELDERHKKPVAAPTPTTPTKKKVIHIKGRMGPDGVIEIAGVEEDEDEEEEDVEMAIVASTPRRNRKRKAAALEAPSASEEEGHVHPPPPTHRSHLFLCKS